MIKEYTIKIEDYISSNKKNINNKKLSLLKKELIEEYKKEYKKFYIININSKNIIEEYNDDIDIEEYNFIIPEYNKKIKSMIEKLQDPMTGIELGINIYIKKIENIYKQVHLLNGSIIKFI